MSSWKIALILAAAALVTGCINPADEQGRAMAQAQARCKGQGKQLHVINVKQDGIPNLTDFHTSVDFECVGPGDPGYVP
jgi:hypothetical protein